MLQLTLHYSLVSGRQILLASLASITMLLSFVQEVSLSGPDFVVMDEFYYYFCKEVLQKVRIVSCTVFLVDAKLLRQNR